MDLYFKRNENLNMLRTIYRSNIQTRAKLDIIKKAVGVKEDWDFDKTHLMMNTCFTLLNSALTGDENLTKKEIEVLKFKYGFDGCGRKTLDETAQQFNCSKRTISRALQNIFSKLSVLFIEKGKLLCAECVDYRVMREDDFIRITKHTTIEDLLHQYGVKTTDLSKIEIGDLLLESDLALLLWKFEVYTIQDLIDFYIEKGPRTLVTIREIGHKNFYRIQMLLKDYVSIEELNKKANKADPFNSKSTIL